MKHSFLFLIIAISCFLWSCGGNADNTSVKEVVALIDAGTKQSQEIESGKLDISDISETDFFTTPNGNIFGNPKILAVIKSNPDYKLSDTDKEMLTTAVEEYFRANTPSGTSTLAGAYADGLNAAGLNIAKEAIEDAKTLNDLYKIALSKEII